LILHRKKNDFAEESKIFLNTDLKIILLNHQNNFVGILKVMSDAAKNFGILILIWAFYIIILIIQQNHFSNLYPAKILDLSAELFFPYEIIRTECQLWNISSTQYESVNRHVLVQTLSNYVRVQIHIYICISPSGLPIMLWKRYDISIYKVQVFVKEL